MKTKDRKSCKIQTYYNMHEPFFTVTQEKEYHSDILIL